MTTTVRLPNRLEQRLAQYCVETRRSKSEVIIELIEQRFSAQTEDQTPYEIACQAGFIGSFAAAPASPGNTKERVKSAIAQKHGRDLA